jgi:hypothetical protein
MVLAIYQIILHLNKIKECLKMTTFKIVFTFDVFLVLKPQCTAKWHVFYIRNRHISVSSFVYKYDQWPHDSYMTQTGRAGVWEADDILKFYIALLDFFLLLYKWSKFLALQKVWFSRYLGSLFLVLTSFKANFDIFYRCHVVVLFAFHK